MKFCPDFSSCCRPAAERTTPTVTQAPLLLRTEDVGDAKRNRSESESVVGAAHWRPKLSMISEDSVVVDSSIKREKKSSTSRSTVKQPKFGCETESNWNPMQMMIPAFSATPFMF